MRELKSTRHRLDSHCDYSPSLRGTKYAFSRQKLNEIVKALRDCGTEEVIKLPKIAVIGNQSAGKSSLIEAISQIKVPRASGTCTRCPMEVVLSSAPLQNGWYCKVSLRIEHADVAGHQMGVFDFGETALKRRRCRYFASRSTRHSKS